MDTGSGTVASCNLFANILVFAVPSASSTVNASIIGSGTTAPSVIGSGPGAQCLGQMNNNVCVQGTAGYTEAESPNITANYCFGALLALTILLAARSFDRWSGFAIIWDSLAFSQIECVYWHGTIRVCTHTVRCLDDFPPSCFTFLQPMASMRQSKSSF